MKFPRILAGALLTLAMAGAQAFDFKSIAGAPAIDPRTRQVLYDGEAVRRLSFIRHARQLGFDLDAIRSLLDLADHPERPCGEANAIAERHLADVRLKIFQLQALQAELSRMTAECAGGRVSACKVIEVLHDPAPRLEAPV